MQATMRRVLLDFRYGSAGVDVESGVLEARLEEQLQEVIDLLVDDGWDLLAKAERAGAVRAMAGQLPDREAAGFLSHAKAAMVRKDRNIELIIGSVTEGNIGKIRIRMANRNEESSELYLGNLARKTATLILESISDLRLNNIAMYQFGTEDALVRGRMVEDIPEPYRFFAKENFPVWVPLTFSLLGLLVGGIMAYFWPDLFLEWYGRLFGPMWMAVVTLFATVYRDRQRTKRQPRRRAEWII